MAVNAVSQTTDSSIYQHYTPAPTTVFTTDGLAGTAAPVTVKTDAAASSADAETLSSIIAKLGSRHTDAQQTYNASGLLNSSPLAGQASISKAGMATPAYDEDLTGFAVVNAGTERGSAVDSTSGVYTAAGDLQNLPIYAADIKNAGGIVNTQA